MKKKKSLPKLKADLQNIFNEFIRLRDAGKPCISCGQIKLLQAGHYFAVKGYDGLRFNEDNCHGECEHDNCFNESHLIGYGINLVDRIGKSRVDILFSDAIEYKQNEYKFSRPELVELIEHYKAEVKQLKTQ